MTATRRPVSDAPADAYPYVDLSVERDTPVEVSVIMPCLNEAESVSKTVIEALAALAAMGVPGEVVVVDNGSEDDSIQRALDAGARVVSEPVRGYGSACRRGLAEARGQYLVLGDADGTYDFSALPRFIEPLHSEADVVIGSRLNDMLEPGAMPWLHLHVGNPILTRVFNRLFSVGVTDTQCGLRSITQDAYRRMRLGSPGMEFASEFLIEAARHRLDIVEVPIAYRRRFGGVPKLRTFRDGARHLRLMLAEAGFSPSRQARDTEPGVVFTR